MSGWRPLFRHQEIIKADDSAFQRWPIRHNLGVSHVDGLVEILEGNEWREQERVHGKPCDLNEISFYPFTGMTYRVTLWPSRYRHE